MQIILSAPGWLLNTAGFVQEKRQLETQPVLKETGVHEGNIYIFTLKIHHIWYLTDFWCHPFFIPALI